MPTIDFPAAQSWFRSCLAQAGSSARPLEDPVAHWCRIVLALDGLGALGEQPDALAELLGRIQTSQSPDTGWFEELAVPVTRTSAGTDEVRRSRATALALQALDALGARPGFRLGFADALASPEMLRSWLETLDWSHPVEAADRITAVMSAFIVQAEHEGSLAARTAYHVALDHLQVIQEHRTGLWGATNETARSDAFLAASRIVPCFAYVRRPLRRVSAIVDGLLDPERRAPEGPAAEHTEPLIPALVRLLAWLRAAGYREAEIRERLREVGTVGLTESAPDQADDRTERKAARLWDRIWALAVLAHAREEEGSGIPDSRDFRNRPGPGYRGAGALLTERERRVLPEWVLPPSLQIPPATDAPALSIVIPCHELGRYLPEALGSVLAQTTRDLEVLGVDDGSRDELTRLVLEQAERRGVRVFRQENAGVAAARNHGIRECRGRYICCLDPDDRIRPGFLARAIETLDRDPEVGLVSGHFRMFDERDETFQFERCGFPEVLAHNPAVEVAVFRKAAWEAVGGYWGGFTRAGIEDWDLWIRILRAGYRAHVIPEVVWEYRIRPNQMSQGMFDPVAWGELCRELAERHPDLYATHLPGIVQLMNQRWAELRAWSQQLERAREWWELQAANWRRLASQKEQHGESLEAWTAEIRRAQEWWQAQAANWERIAAEKQFRIDELERHLGASVPVPETPSSPPDS